jgi:hypothetical protein
MEKRVLAFLFRWNCGSAEVQSAAVPVPYSGTPPLTAALESWQVIGFIARRRPCSALTAAPTVFIIFGRAVAYYVVH